MADTSDAALAASLPGDFRNGYAEVNGTRIHYVEGGKGTPVLLLPGWPQTWWEFHKIMPELAKRHRVIAVDLRGMGGSAKPGLGYDKKNMAKDIHELTQALGYKQVNIAGHDIGAMVAYSFAANYPDATLKICLIDVAQPRRESLHTVAAPATRACGPRNRGINPSGLSLVVRFQSTAGSSATTACWEVQITDRLALRFSTAKSRCDLGA